MKGAGVRKEFPTMHCLAQLAGTFLDELLLLSAEAISIGNSRAKDTEVDRTDPMWQPLCS